MERCAEGGPYELGGLVKTFVVYGSKDKGYTVAIVVCGCSGGASVLESLCGSLAHVDSFDGSCGLWFDRVHVGL